MNAIGYTPLDGERHRRLILTGIPSAPNACEEERMWPPILLTTLCRIRVTIPFSGMRRIGKDSAMPVMRKSIKERGGEDE